MMFVDVETRFHEPQSIPFAATPSCGVPVSSILLIVQAPYLINACHSHGILGTL